MKLSSILASAAYATAMLLSSCGSSSTSDYYDNVDLFAATTSKDGKWSMVNAKGEIVYDSEFKNQPRAAYNGLFSVQEGDGYTVYQAGGKDPQAVIGLEGLKSVGYLEDGLLPVTFPGKRISIVDANGKFKFELIPTKGGEIIRCNPGYQDGMLVYCTEDQKYGYVDKSGNYVIEPLYDEAYEFSEGVAVVGKKKEESGDMAYSVIDKSGNEIFKIKDGYTLQRSMFEYGYIVAQKDDRCFLFNKKGEEIKLNSKAYIVQKYNDKYIIFASSDVEIGVMNFKNEIIIRPKYSEIQFGNGDFFIAKKDSKDKELVKIGTNGEESDERIDYEDMRPFGKFGYMAREGKTYVLLNDSFEKKDRNEFFDYSFNRGDYYVYTDYFNPAAVAEDIVKMIDGNHIGYLELGKSAEDIMSNLTPYDCANKTSYDCPDLSKDGFRYQISVMGNFSEKMADYNYEAYSWSRNYFWNPDSKLMSVILNLSTQGEWGAKGQEALQTALTNAGYKLLKEGTSKTSENYADAVFKKGNVLVYVSTQSNGTHVLISICSDSYEASVLQMMKTAGDSDYTSDTADFGCDIDDSAYENITE
ncbi:MAG: WG repeat-containing protein [Paramuribaculum sp.]|nr:WG repeat-containing protein [Paramuribaculum sp.]